MIKTLNFKNLSKVLLVLLRTFIGWHLLYEGLVKLMEPTWTSATFLQGAKGFLSGFYHWLGSEQIVGIIDFINIWGLILIGSGLVLGLFTRISAIAGAALLLLYYFAYPPYGILGYGIPAEGNYLIINKNLIEFIALTVIAVMPMGTYFGIDALIFRKKAIEKLNQPSENGTKNEVESQILGRRRLLKGLATLPLMGLFGFLAYKNKDYQEVDATSGSTISLSDLGLHDIKGKLQQGTLGKQKLSRIILGCNLIGGYSHSRDLLYVSSLFKAYNTSKKIYETYYLAEQAGINACFTTNDFKPFIDSYYKIYGGKMKTVCQTYIPEESPMSDIKQAIDNGMDYIYIQGAHADRLVKNNQIELLGDAIDYIKKQGITTGIGAHSIETIMASEKHGLKPDFYVKTLHHDKYWSAHPVENRVEFSVDAGKYPDHNQFHDNMFDLFPEKTIAFMEQVNKPWIAFKVLAAGAIHPKDGFRYAFKNGADFICVGMFDFQVVENVNTTYEILASDINRKRNWMA